MTAPDTIQRMRLSRIREAEQILNAPGFYDEYVGRGTIEGKYLLVKFSDRKAMCDKYPYVATRQPVSTTAAAQSVKVLSVVNCGNCQPK